MFHVEIRMEIREKNIFIFNSYSWLKVKKIHVIQVRPFLFLWNVFSHTKWICIQQVVTNWLEKVQFKCRAWAENAELVQKMPSLHQKTLWFVCNAYKLWANKHRRDMHKLKWMRYKQTLSVFGINELNFDKLYCFHIFSTSERNKWVKKIFIRAEQQVVRLSPQTASWVLNLESWNLANRLLISMPKKFPIF